LLTSFTLSESGVVEIIFSFDTTGSMSACLTLVRQKLKETATRLTKDIPKIRIGFIAHGDYCDYSNYVIEKLDFTNNVQELVSWVDRIGNSGGGDAPEAYELALKEAKSFSWSPGSSKALVVIGDEVPHEPSYTKEKINWWEELDQLIDMGVKIYGVRALNSDHAKYFYEELSERSGAVSIRFQSFQLIVDMFLAICYRESGLEKLKQFQEEVQTRQSEESSSTKEEMNQIFETLAKPNTEVKKEKPKVMKCSESWYDISKDSGHPQYEYYPKLGRWGTIGTPPPAKTTSSFTTPTPSYSSSTTSSRSRTRSSSVLNFRRSRYPSTTTGLVNVKCVLVGDEAVGKTSLLILYTTNVFPSEAPKVHIDSTVSVVYEGKPVLLGLWDTAGQEDYDRLRPLSYPQTDIFLVCFNIKNTTSFLNIEARWLPEIFHHCPGTPFLIVGCKSDLRGEEKEKEVNETEAKEFATKVKAGGYVECSSLTQSNLKLVFDTALKTVFDGSKSSNNNNNGKKCVVM